MEGEKGETEKSGAGGRSGKSGRRRGEKVKWTNLWSIEETEWGDKEEAS